MRPWVQAGLRVPHILQAPQLFYLPVGSGFRACGRGVLSEEQEAGPWPRHAPDVSAVTGASSAAVPHQRRLPGQPVSHLACLQSRLLPWEFPTSKGHHPSPEPCTPALLRALVCPCLAACLPSGPHASLHPISSIPRGGAGVGGGRRGAVPTGPPGSRHVFPAPVSQPQPVAAGSSLTLVTLVLVVPQRVPPSTF